MGHISYSLNSLKVFSYGILVEYQRVIKGNTRSLDCSSSAGVAHSSSMIDSFSHQVGPKEVQADLSLKGSSGPHNGRDLGFRGEGWGRGMEGGWRGFWVQGCCRSPTTHAQL